MTLLKRADASSPTPHGGDDNARLDQVPRRGRLQATFGEQCRSPRTELAEASEKFGRTRERLRQWRVDATAKAEEEVLDRNREATERYDKALADAENRARETTTEARDALRADRTMAVEWRDGQDRIGRA